MVTAPYPVELPDVNYFSRQVLCREGCPVRTDSGGYVQAIAEGRYEDAYIIARAPNPFASICGRVCAAPCEAKCRRGALDSAVSIRALKRFVCEKYGVESDRFDLGRVYPALRAGQRERLGSGRKVAVVGAGPAGLSCAHELALMGFSPTVFEAHQVAGGMLVLGVPEYRLPREIIRAEIQAIESLGVEIRLQRRLGRDFTLADLKRQGFEAIFLGIGAHKSRELAIEGVQLDGVLRAIEFLLNINLGFRVSLGRKVVVIGGGNPNYRKTGPTVRIDRGGYGGNALSHKRHASLHVFSKGAGGVSVNSHLCGPEPRKIVPQDFGPESHVVMHHVVQQLRNDRVCILAGNVVGAEPVSHHLGNFFCGVAPVVETAHSPRGPFRHRSFPTPFPCPGDAKRDCVRVVSWCSGNRECLLHCRRWRRRTDKSGRHLESAIALTPLE